MPNTYKKITNRDFDPNAMKQAIQDVFINKLSIRKSATKNEIKKSRLALYVKKAKVVGIDNMEFKPDFCKSQILLPEMEVALEEYLLKSAAMFYGLTPKLVRRLAYEYATRNLRKTPDKWETDKMATESWFTNFMRRHPRLSVRKPEATSLARMSSFNKSNVELFYNKLQEVLTRYSFTPAQIFNLDETGDTTVQRVQKIVGKKGEHQIGKVTSRERGELLTHVGIICANGNALPPIWIFPRHRFDAARMMKGIPDDGPMGLAYHSGWMTCENFLKMLEHFVKHVKCNTQDRVLLIMDNHESHVSLNAVEFCRANGIVILTLPPHTSNKLQPLDRTVFGPFKTFFNQAADAWMLSHPGQTLTIYDLPLMCLKSWDRAANPVNIKSGFRCTGIIPFDRNIFGEEEFLPSAVTDRPMPKPNDALTTPTAMHRPMTPDYIQMPSTFSTSPTRLVADANISSKCSAAESINSPNSGSVPNSVTVELATEDKTLTANVTPCKSKQSKSNFLSPELIQPYPKAPARKENSKRGRKRGRCTPEKVLLEEKIKEKQDKIAAKKKKAVTRKVLQDESSDDESNTVVEYADHSSDDSIILEEDREDKDVSKGDYIVANVYGKTCVRKYVAIVDDIYEEGYEVRFLKRNLPSNKFSFTSESAAIVFSKDVVAVLPKPIKDKRPRFEGMVYFNIDLTELGLV